MKNEILEEQRKARKQYLELKKMQEGKTDAPPKPSEEAHPLTTSEKIKNFWDYHKGHITGIILALAIIIFSIRECANRVKPDINVLLFSYTGMTAEQVELLTDYMETVCDDNNGDGQVKVGVIDCSYNNKSEDKQYEYTVLNKLQATLAADDEALLFVTDKESYQYFLKDDSMKGLFTSDPIPFSKEFCERVSTDEQKFIGEYLQISCRTYYGTYLEGKKDVEARYNSAQKIVEDIKK